VKGLDGVYCFIQNCKDPICIHDLVDGATEAAGVDFDRAIKVEEEKCLARSSDAGKA
jgi:hypothetical protein